MLARCSQRASLRTTSLPDRGTLFHILLADRTDCFTRLFYLPRFGAGRLFHTWATTSSTPIRQLLLVGTLLSSFPSREYLDLTHCDCPLLLKQNRTFPHPRRQARRQFERQPYFLTNSLSLHQTTHSPDSFSSHNDGSYKDLRTFTASLLVHLGPLSGSSPCW